MNLLYTKEYILRSTDVDKKRRLRLSSLFVMLQEAAIAHTTQLGMGRHMTLDKGFLWIITLQNVNIKRLPVYDEKIILESWPGKTMRMFFPRYCQIKDEEGNIIIEASTIWGLMDCKDRHLIFPEEHGIVINENKEKPVLPFPMVKAFNDLTESGTFTVPYSYIDLNGHMNNTRYFDLAEDVMDDKLRYSDIREIQSEFSGEAPEGSKINLYTRYEEKTFMIEGRSKENRKLFKLLFRYE